MVIQEKSQLSWQRQTAKDPDLTAPLGAAV